MACDCRDTRLAIIRLKSRSITASRAEPIQNRCSLILMMIASWSRSARIALRKAYAQQAPSVPGPLPIFGVASAFAFSRNLRRRIKLAAPIEL